MPVLACGLRLLPRSALAVGGGLSGRPSSLDRLEAFSPSLLEAFIKLMRLLLRELGLFDLGHFSRRNRLAGKFSGHEH